MKAVLVIDDMPTECIECPFCRVFADNKLTRTHCILTAQRNEDGVNTRAEWCPLKPLPKKEIVLERKINGVTANYLEMAEARIRNRVIDEILGKGEQNEAD